MREELIQNIMIILLEHGVDDDDIRNDITILLADYDIAARETALTVRSEDLNAFYLKKFITAKIVQGCTERTIKLYTIELKRILANINKPANEITTDDIRYYLALRDRRDKVSKRTQSNELRYMSTFFGYLHNQELIRSNPVVKMERIKYPKVKLEAFSEMDVEKLRAGCRNAKEEVIVEVLLSTGCRVSELVGIRLKEIKDGALVVHGKGGKDRKVYLNAKAQLAIDRYISERTDSNPYLLPRMVRITKMERHQLRDAYRYKENILPDGHMDTASVEDLVRRIGKRSGVEGAHPHRFRRTCATFALRRGMPIEQVSKMLGHEQLSTTQIYLDLDEKDLEQAHRRFVI